MDALFIIAIIAALIALAIVRAVMRRPPSELPPAFRQELADYYTLRREPAEAMYRNFLHGIVSRTLDEIRNNQEGGEQQT